MNHCGALVVRSAAISVLLWNIIERPVAAVGDVCIAQHLVMGVVHLIAIYLGAVEIVLVKMMTKGSPAFVEPHLEG